ncbi:MAG: winged helix-turn-helix domain-containing protein [Elusimicrobiota bacterium]
MCIMSSCPLRSGLIAVIARTSARGLYPMLGSQQCVDARVMDMMWIFAYADGNHDLCRMASIAEAPLFERAEIAKVLLDKGLFKISAS